MRIPTKAPLLAPALFVLGTLFIHAPLAAGNADDAPAIRLLVRGDVRQGVVEAGTSSKVKEVVARRGIQLISYRELGQR